jgi:hypothetical protein
MLKTLHATALATTLLCVAGCSSSSTRTARNNTGVAGLLAGSMPGAVSQNGQTITATKTAVNSPNVTNIMTAVNTANKANTNTTGVTNALTPSNIMAAIAAVQAANAAKQAQQPFQGSPNAIGPGPIFIGPGVFVGPGPFASPTN